MREQGEASAPPCSPTPPPLSLTACRVLLSSCDLDHLSEPAPPVPTGGEEAGAGAREGRGKGAGRGEGRREEAAPILQISRPFCGSSTSPTWRAHRVAGGEARHARWPGGTAARSAGRSGVDDDVKHAAVRNVDGHLAHAERHVDFDAHVARAAEGGRVAQLDLRRLAVLALRLDLHQPSLVHGHGCGCRGAGGGSAVSCCVFRASRDSGARPPSRVLIEGQQ